MSPRWFYPVAFLLALFPAANTLIPELEHDTWWHLRIGRFIAQTNTVPETDPISRFGRDERVPWRAYSWLYEVAVYHVHTAGGVAGVMWFRTLLATASTATLFAFAFRRCGVSPTGLLVAAGLVLPVMLMAPERPWHITIAFTTLTLWATTAIREGMPVVRAWWLVPVFALWANLHIQYVLGWGVLGLGVLFPAAANRRHLLLLLLGTVAATAANPYHVHLFQVIWEYVTQAAPRSLVQELAPASLFSHGSLAVIALAGWAVVKLIRRRPVDLFEVGLLLAGAFFASRMCRDLWFGAVAAAAVIRGGAADLPRRGTAVAAVAVVVAAFVLLRVLNSAGLMRETDHETAQAKRFPVRAVEFLKQARPPGPIFNDFEWGGYLSWELEEYPVSFDGRTNLYGSERMMQSFRTWSTPDGWQTDDDFRTARLVLAQHGLVLVGVLRDRKDEWRVIYEDDVSVVFERIAP